MKPRKLLLILADLILLGVCIFQWTKGGKSDVKYFELSDTPDELIIQGPDTSFNIVKTGDHWFIGEKKLAANDSSIQGLVDKISSVKALNKVAKANTEANLSRYELDDEHKITVTAKAAGNVIRTLTIGKDSNGTQGYVCFDDSTDIYLVASNLHYVFSKTEDDLRSHIIYDFENGAVTYVEVSEADGRKWSLSRTVTEDSFSWKTTGFDEIDVDTDKTSDWMDAISSLMTSKWHDENYVIPAAKILTFNIATDSEKVVLDIYEDYNEEEETGSYYGRCNLTDYPFEIAEYTISKFLKEPEEFAK